jgi:hypothetical protein
MPTLAPLAANLALCDGSLTVHEAPGSSACSLGAGRSVRHIHQKRRLSIVSLRMTGAACAERGHLRSRHISNSTGRMTNNAAGP